MSVTEGNFEHTSRVAVSRGLHVLRYVSALPADSPIVVVWPAAGSEAWLEIVSAPGAVAGLLDGPGACLAVRAERDATLEIGVRPRFAGGPLEASLRLEALVLSESSIAAPLGAAPAKTPVAKPQLALAPEPAPPEPSGISLLAHVALRGDVEVGESEWAAGPESPSPIEGLEIRARSPDRVEVEMQVAVVGTARWSEWVGAGAYAGTRGRGLPLAGVRLRLAGTEASRMEISADALFLGSLILSKRGREVELTSSTGADPLVGFKLAVRPFEKAAVIQAAASGWRERGARVRVFSSSTGV